MDPNALDTDCEGGVKESKHNQSNLNYPQKHTCCGIEFVQTKPSPKTDWKTPRDECFQWCRENRAPIQFHHVVYMAICLTLFIVAIVVIANNQPTINECRDEFKGQAQLDCMLESKSAIGAYAIGFCLLFGSALTMARVLLWLFHKRFRTWVDSNSETPRTYQCIDGKPNKHFQKRIFWIVHILLFLGFLFMAVYFAQFVVHTCDKDDTECHNAKDKGYIVGLLAGVVGVVITILMGSITGSYVYKS